MVETVLSLAFSGVICKFMVFSDKIKYSYKIQQIGGRSDDSR